MKSIKTKHCKKCGGSGMILDKNDNGFMRQISTTEIDFTMHFVACDKCNSDKNETS